MILTVWLVLMYQGWTMQTKEPQPEISFELSMDRAHQHYFDVTMTVAKYPREYVDLVLPVWAPGSYKIRDFSRNIESLSAFDSKGNPLRSEKTAKNIWRIHTHRVPDFKVRYDYYAFELTVRTSFLDSDHGFINGSNLFFYVEGKKDVPYTLHINMPSQWKNISTGLRSLKGRPSSFMASNYDELADCPIEIGNHEVIRFEFRGAPHEIAIFGFGEFEAQRLVQDVSKIMETSAAMFGGIPYDKYVYIVHMLPRQGGGLEHLNSTTLGVDSWFFNDPERYLNFLGLVAHEYFHLWNVKRLRPAELGPFDYTKENYTGLLWVAEGFTSYFDEQIVLRSGFMNPEKYLQRLENSVADYLKIPGRLIQPLDESSFDSWIKFYVTDENTHNSSVSYYTKGAMVALALDLEIMGRTGGKKRLDDLVRWMWEQTYLKGRGYTMTDVLHGLAATADGPWESLVDSLVSSPAEIDFDAFLRHAGMRLEVKPSNRLSMGVALENNRTDNAIVRSIIRNSPAQESGLNPGDEIVAINGIRTDARSFDQRIQNYRPDDTVTLLVSRSLKLREIECKIVRERPVYRFAKQVQTTELQNRIYSIWLNQQPNQ